jgi:hypothetical protein
VKGLGIKGVGIVPPSMMGGNFEEQYILRDDYLDTRIPGAISLTLAVPGPGIRTMVDGEVLDYLSNYYVTWPLPATPSNADDNIGYFDKPISHKAGRVFYSTMRLQGTSGNMYPLVVLNSAAPNWINNHDICMLLAGVQLGVRPFNSTAQALIQNKPGYPYLGYATCHWLFYICPYW